MLLVDTHVLWDALQDDPLWGRWSIGQLRAQASVRAPNAVKLQHGVRGAQGATP